MIVKPGKANRPRGIEYITDQVNLVLVQSGTQDERIWEHDVLCYTHLKTKYFYIVIYREDVNAFTAYPLGGHSIKETHIEKLEIFENVFDFYIKYEEYRKQLPINGPYKTFAQNLEFYLNTAGKSLYR